MCFKQKKEIQASGAQRQRYHMSTQYTMQQIPFVLLVTFRIRKLPRGLTVNKTGEIYYSRMHPNPKQFQVLAVCALRMLETGPVSERRLPWMCLLEYVVIIIIVFVVVIFVVVVPIFQHLN